MAKGLQKNSSLIPKSFTSQRLLVYIESLTGMSFKLDVFPTDTIFQIKEQLEARESIPVRHQHLIWRFKELMNESTVDECGVGFGARLTLVVDLIAGPITRRLNREEVSKRSLTLLLFQSDEQLKVISFIKTNDNSISAEKLFNYFETNDYFRNSLNSELFANCLKDDKQCNNDLNEIHSQMKAFVLRNEINSYDKQTNHINSNETTIGAKLPHLGQRNGFPHECTKRVTESQTDIHFPLISNKTKSLELNESAKHVKRIHCLNQLFISSLSDCKTFSTKPNLRSNYKIQTKEFHGLDLQWNRHSLVKLRPLTAPVDNGINDSFNYVNILSKVLPNIESNFLTKPQNSVKRLNCSQKLPSIQNMSEKKADKIRCSLCRLKLHIVNRYNCRCGLLYCAKHRYPETHSCSYDYKGDGRKYIQHNNPFVSGKKLPQI